MGSIGGEGPAPVFQVRVSNVGLVALEGAPKSKGVLSARPCRVVPNVARIANELCVRKVPDCEVIAKAETSNASLRLWKLKDSRSEVGHLCNLATLAAVRGFPDYVYHYVVHQIRADNRRISHDIILALYGGAGSDCQ